MAIDSHQLKNGLIFVTMNWLSISKYICQSITTNRYQLDDQLDNWFQFID